MPGHSVIIRTCDVTRSPRVVQVESMFDVPPSEKSTLEWDVSLPLDEKPWQIGLVVGPSGCGKTTIAREIWPGTLIDGFRWPQDKAIIDCFPKGIGIKQVTSLLGAVGFGTVPAWLRPFHVLSNGEQFRATLARALAQDVDQVVIDEFTSVVDRDVAKIASAAVAKTIRRGKSKRLIALSCHYDIIDWLQPDWVYQPNCDRFAWRCLQCRPELELQVYPVDRSAWSTFARYHYLSGHLLGSATCFGGFLGDRCVAFSAIRHLPHPRVKNIKMGHRLVVLPEFQGLGIGGRMDDLVGQWLYEKGQRYHNRVAHPAMIRYYSRSPRWRCIGGRRNPCGVGGTQALAREQTSTRLLVSMTFEYVPPAKAA